MNWNPVPQFGCYIAILIRRSGSPYNPRGIACIRIVLCRPCRTEQSIDMESVVHRRLGCKPADP